MAILDNQYRLPYGSVSLQKYNQQASLVYIPFNGWRPHQYAPNNNRSTRTIMILTIASVPADLSTLILSGPDEVAYKFQFVRAGSVATVGFPIAVPAGGGTVAQTQAAIVAAINAGAGVQTDVLGVTRYFPFTAAPSGGTVVNVTTTIPGPVAVIAGTQATITATYSQSPLLGLLYPGSVGKLAAAVCGI